MSEHDHQVALFQWAAVNLGSMPELAAMYAIPNGGARSKATAGKLKAEGVKAGIPDICLPLPTANAGALYIELKVPKSTSKRAGRESNAQKNMRKLLQSLGNHVIVAYGWEEAAGAVEAYVERHRVWAVWLKP